MDEPHGWRLGRAERLALTAVPLLVVFFLAYLPLLQVAAKPGPSTLADVLSDPAVRRVAAFTFKQALISAALSVALGAPAGAIMALRRPRGSGLVSALSLVAFMSPPMVVAVGFRAVYGRGGVLSSLVPQLRVLGEGFWGIIAAHVFYNSPIALNLVYTALSAVPRELMDSSRLFGSRLDTVRSVLIPYAAPALAASFVLAYMYCFTSFAIPITIGASPRYNTLESYLYTVYRFLYTDPGQAARAASALALLQASLLAPFAAIYVALSRRLPHAPVGEAARPAGRPGFAASMYMALLAAFYALPLASIYLRALVDPYTGSVSLSGYRAVLGDEFRSVVQTSHAVVLANTAYYAYMVVLISLTISTLLAVSESRLAEIVAVSVIAVSPATLGLALYLAYSEIGARWLLIILAHVAAGLPIVSRPIVLGFHRALSREIVDPLRLYAKSMADGFLNVLAPLLRNQYLVAASLAAVVSLGEFGATMMLHTRDTLTLSIAVHKLAAARRPQMAFAEASILTTLSLALLVFLARWRQRWL